MHKQQQQKTRTMWRDGNDQCFGHCLKSGRWREKLFFWVLVNIQCNGFYYAIFIHILFLLILLPLLSLPVELHPDPLHCTPVVPFLPSCHMWPTCLFPNSFICSRRPLFLPVIVSVLFWWPVSIHVYKKIKYKVLLWERTCGISLSESEVFQIIIIISRPIHFLWISCFYGWIKFHCAHVPHFHYPFVCWWHLGWFHFLAIVTSATISWMCKYLCSRI